MEWRVSYQVFKYFLIFVLETWFAEKYLISQTADGPPVDRFAVALPVHEFGRVLLGCAANGFGTVIVIYIKLALAEVSQFDLAVGRNQHVFRLQVTLDDVQPVQLANHDHHLWNVEHGHIFIQSLVFGAGNVEEQLAAGALVHHEADLLRTHEAVVQCHDEFVSDLL